MSGSAGGGAGVETGGVETGGVDTGVTTFNLADLWEAVARAVPDRVAVISEGTGATYRELDERASRLAHWLLGRGIGPGDRVGVMLRNVPEHLETYLACFKIRAVPVNVNFRCTAAELGYLVGDAPLSGLVADPEFLDVVTACRSDGGEHWWVLATGTDYEAALRSGGEADAGAGGDADVGAGAGAGRGPGPFPPRSSDAEYVIYTGGTTGDPKGVVWRMEDAFFACIGGGDPTGERRPITRPGEIVERIDAVPTRFLPAAPLMHAAGSWPTLRWLLAGGAVVLVRDFDAARIWDAIAEHHVDIMNIVADAMAGPLLEAFQGRDRADHSSLRMIASGGAPLSEQGRTRLCAALPGLVIRDIYGSSETGVQGWSDWRSPSSGPSRFVSLDTVLVDPETRDEAAPGTEGLIARRDHVPAGYHGDPDKSAQVFLTQGGRRLAVTGDLGRFNPDGTLTVIGRRSGFINTGGEKVNPTEVETVLRDHEQVADVLVLSEPSERWGQQVVAIVVGGGSGPDIAALDTHCRESLAGYKVPRRYITVDALTRKANGKPDHAWAAEVVSTTPGGTP
ncbi:MAG TPA: AMP-binding protein [Pseudonocardia sp.]|nr:AMP-binding protein [Pseudonocardia sp.]